MKRITSIITIVFVICACENSYELKPDVNKACTRWFDRKINALLSSNVELSIPADSILDYKLLNENGSRENLNYEKFTQKVCQLTKDTKLNFPLPYAEIQGTNMIVVFTTGKGLWGEVYSFVLFDKEKQEIIDVRCDHIAEAQVTKISFKDTTYSNRYKGLKINTSRISEIDGISGATITSAAYEKSIVEGVRKYSKIWL